MKIRRTVLACSLAAISAQALADGDKLEVVTVTAQKRKEDPNKVAMSISAISGASLLSQQVSDFTDLTRAVPNISFTAATGNGYLNDLWRYLPYP